MDDTRRILASFFDTVWSGGDIDALDSFFTQTAEHQGVMPDFPLSLDELRIFVTQIRQLADDIDVTLAHSVANGPWLSAFIIVTARATGSTNTINVTGQVMIRTDQGKIAEMYHSFDFLSFFEQLGQLPAGTLAVLMAGSSLD